MKLSPLPSKLNPLLLGILFYLLDCRHYFYRWFLVPVGVYSTEVLFPGFRLGWAVVLEVT